MKFDRIKEIETYIADHESVSIDKLCEVFNVSKNTIRRDINELIEKGSIEKIYGGVIAKDRNLFVSFEERNAKNSGAKMMIGESAAAFVRDNDIIFLDSGTTTFYMTGHIKELRNVTVITHNIHVITALFFHHNINIISLGGALMHKTGSFGGLESINMLKNYNITKAFMSTTGVSIENGLTNSSMAEFEIKKAVAQKAGEIYLLADSSKFGISSLYTYCNLEEVAYVITDRKLPDKYYHYFQQHDINLVV